MFFSFNSILADFGINFDTTFTRPMGIEIFTLGFVRSDSNTRIFKNRIPGFAFTTADGPDPSPAPTAEISFAASSALSFPSSTIFKIRIFSFSI